MPATEGPPKGPPGYSYKITKEDHKSLETNIYSCCLQVARHTSPTQALKYSKAGLRIAGENVINDVPFLKKFWLQKRLDF